MNLWKIWQSPHWAFIVAADTPVEARALVMECKLEEGLALTCKQIGVAATDICTPQIILQGYKDRPKMTR